MQASLSLLFAGEGRSLFVLAFVRSLFESGDGRGAIATALLCERLDAMLKLLAQTIEQTETLSGAVEAREQYDISQC